MQLKNLGTGIPRAGAYAGGMSVKRTRQNRWVAGDVASWMLGVTLGLILGIALLIVGTRVWGAKSQTSANASTASTGTATTASGANMASAGSNGNPAQGAQTGSTPAPTEGNSTTRGGGGTAQNTQLPAPVQGTSETMTGNGTTGTENTSQQPGTPPAGEAAGATTTGTAAAGTGPTASGTGNAAEGGAATTAGSNSGEAGAPAGAGNASAGQTVFASNCAGCHGANAQGGIGPSLVTADGPKSWTLAQFSAALRQGHAPDRELSTVMPRFSQAQISDAQIADLQAYLKTLQ